MNGHLLRRPGRLMSALNGEHDYIHRSSSHTARSEPRCKTWTSDWPLNMVYDYIRQHEHISWDAVILPVWAGREVVTSLDRKRETKTRRHLENLMRKSNVGNG